MNKYRASIATAVLGVVTLSHAQSLGHSSFSSSLIASAMSKFHGVKAPARSNPAIVAAVVTRPGVGDVVKLADVKPVTQVKTVAVAQVPAAVAVVATHPNSIPVIPAAPAAVTPAAAKPFDPKVERVLTPEEIERDLREASISGPMVDPNSISLDMPGPDPALIDPTPQQAAATKKLKIKWVEEGYFDAGYERLLGTFTTQIIRYGIRYGQDDFHAYFRNETLDTIGTGLPYPQAVTGTSVGVEARHWFPGNEMYASVSMGEGIGGYNNNRADFRYGLVGYHSWAQDRWFSDFYGELFYIAIADDTFLDWRLRSGRKIKIEKNGYWWDYVVGQFWVSGQTESGTENRAETGIGIAYVFQQAISINFELRGGYAFRTGIDDSGDRVYFNPTIILSGGFYKGNN